MATPAYTVRDLRRAAKELAAAMTALHARITDVSAAAGRMIGIMDDLGEEPLCGSSAYRGADEAIGELGAAYDKLARILSQ